MNMLDLLSGFLAYFLGVISAFLGSLLDWLNGA